MSKLSCRRTVGVSLVLFSAVARSFVIPSVPRNAVASLRVGASDDKEPSITINGEEIEASTESNNNIFGATAAMATAADTPMETTLSYVDVALSHLSLINSEGQSITSPEDIASLVQGHRVAFYFGAGWCPACRELEYMLPQYMKALGESEQHIRLIYVPSDMSLDFQLDRMQKMDCLKLGVPFGKEANQLKEKYGIWSGMEAKQFQDCKTKRRSGVPAFVVLDTQGQELMFLDTESQTIAALGDWPLDDPKGIF